MKLGEFLGWLFTAMVASVVFVTVWMVFVWTPVYLWSEGTCLDRGMATARVTMFLSRYCTNLDGAVTIRVEKL